MPQMYINILLDIARPEIQKPLTEISHRCGPELSTLALLGLRTPSGVCWKRISHWPIL